jgi:uncharacterized RDD family membrane protein YckC
VYPDQPVVTGEAVALDLRHAGIGSRGIATLIDLAIEYAALLLLFFVVAFLGAVTSVNGDALAALAIVVVVGVLLGYPVILETLWSGQTIGKKVMGLRVVRDDGGPIRFRHAFVRGIVGVILEKPTFVTIPALISMSVTKQHKRVGDLMAGTVVLQQRVPGQIDAPVEMPPPLANWAASLDLASVDDGLAMRLRQFLGRAHGLTADTRAALEQQLCAEVVARVGPPPAGTPPWALLAAVLAERRRRAFNHYAGPQPAVQPVPQAQASPAATEVPPAEAPASTTGFVAPS